MACPVLTYALTTAYLILTYAPPYGMPGVADRFLSSYEQASRLGGQITEDDKEVLRQLKASLPGTTRVDPVLSFVLWVACSLYWRCGQSGRSMMEFVLCCVCSYCGGGHGGALATLVQSFFFRASYRSLYCGWAGTTVLCSAGVRFWAGDAFDQEVEAELQSQIARMDALLNKAQ
eukprot:3843612-Rhodomonas_salina.1